MKKLNLVFILFMAISYISCSSDDEIDPPIETVNGFNFKGEFFPTQHASIKDDNTSNDDPSNIAIILANVDPFATSRMTGVNYFYFAFEAINIEAGTITPIYIYSLRENANLQDTLITDGNTILGHDDARIRNRAVSSSVIIHSISADEIDLDFEFTREDGEIITGNYKGTYVDASNMAL